MDLNLDEAMALEKPHIKLRFGYWLVAGRGRFALGETMREAWELWLGEPMGCV